ncbi:hypothetical protein BpHYR1_039791 [Brachionus plicatilis]|uniref:Uncharacterized protein n=1 Tax=Brachionus plicatilis TaxID=10195 RepID=A0A3M7PGJ6_BRAPC|nr:hypothetical protein BpHYR1_039791 [Brachionus plicatilis]
MNKLLSIYYIENKNFILGLRIFKKNDFNFIFLNHRHQNQILGLLVRHQKTNIYDQNFLFQFGSPEGVY